MHCAEEFSASEGSKTAFAEGDTADLNIADDEEDTGLDNDPYLIDSMDEGQDADEDEDDASNESNGNETKR